MFKWHKKESGQRVEQEVIRQLYYETNGQPGITCWFGELLTEGWEKLPVTKDMPIDMELFKKIYAAAEAVLPRILREEASEESFLLLRRKES